MDISQLIEWAVLFAISLFALVKGAAVVIDSLKVVGQAFRMSSFLIGVLLVGLGTSLPELATAIMAAYQGVTEFVSAQVVGSNVTTILLVVGVMSTMASRLVIKQDFVKTELVLFVIAQAVFIGVIADGYVDRIDAGFLLAIFGAYLCHIMTVKSVSAVRTDEKLSIVTVVMLLLGLAAVLIGAHFVVATAVQVARAFSVPVGLISMTAVALGLSLPGLAVAIAAARRGEVDLALGSILGTNIFNSLVIIGVSALVTPLVVDTVVLRVGAWFMLAAAVIMFTIVLSNQLLRFGGLMMIIFFAYFLTKLTVFL